MIKTQLWVGLLAAAVGLAQSPQVREQTIWFSPLDPEVRPWFNVPGNPVMGSLDFMQLFSPSAPWQTAASHVNVFKINESLPDLLSDNDLSGLLADLQRRNIALAMDVDIVIPEGGCGFDPVTGNFVEGFGTQGVLTRILTRLKALGGNLQYLSLDEPFQHASLYSGPLACHWSAQQIAQNLLTTLVQVKALFPNIKIGDIEVVPDIDNVPDWLSQYAGWIDTWAAVMGTPLAFFHADNDWPNPSWRAGVDGLRQAVTNRGIPFGMIYNGWNLTDFSDAAWLNDAESHYVTYETQGEEPPDHVLFQSWDVYPTHVLPESDPTAFTHLINTYFRTRTWLDFDRERAGNRNQLAGKLSSVSGSSTTPLASAAIQVTAAALDGPGLVNQRVYTGVVPSFAQYATVGLRVNEECTSCAGAVKLNVMNFSYSEGHGQNLVSNPAFATGLQYWGIGGTATATWKVDPQTGIPELNVSSTATQSLFVNSTFSPVTAGSNYQISWTSQVAPQAPGGGYFTLIFLADSSASGESSRVEWPFATAAVNLGSTTTAADGSFVMPIPESSANGLRIELSYAGTNTLWPALATVDFGIPRVRSRR